VVKDRLTAPNEVGMNSLNSQRGVKETQRPENPDQSRVMAPMTLSNALEKSKKIMVMTFRLSATSPHQESSGEQFKCYDPFCKPIEMDPFCSYLL